MGRKGNVDLSIKKNAEASKNSTAMIGIFIMNLVLAVAYLLEVVKGARDFVSYAIIASLCIVPCILALIVYLRKKDAHSIRYILGKRTLI